MSLVLFVGGLYGAGKDVAADHLVAEHGFVKLGMSDTLAEALYRLNPWISYGNGMGDFDPSSPAGPVEFYDLDTKQSGTAAKPFFLEADYGQVRYRAVVDAIGYVEAKKHVEVRRLLQVLGTEVGRQLLGEDIWVEAAKRRIEAELDAGHDVVITGTRFQNELDLVYYFNEVSSAGHQAASVFVVRPALEQAAGTASHASETSLSIEDFEYDLRNDSDIPALERQTGELLEAIRADFEDDISIPLGTGDVDG